MRPLIVTDSLTAWMVVRPSNRLAQKAVQTGQKNIKFERLWKIIVGSCLKALQTSSGLPIEQSASVSACSPASSEAIARPQNHLCRAALHPERPRQICRYQSSSPLAGFSDRDVKILGLEVKRRPLAIFFSSSTISMRIILSVTARETCCLCLRPCFRPLLVPPCLSIIDFTMKVRARSFGSVSRGIRAIKSFEYLLQFARRDADSFVPNDNRDLVAESGASALSPVIFGSSPLYFTALSRRFTNAGCSSS